MTSAPGLHHIVLDELALKSKPVMLPEGVREALEATKLVVVRGVGRGRWMLLPNGYVGAVQIGSLLVEVRPKDKVGVAQILFLLSYAKDPGFRPDNVQATTTSDLWAALGETLARLGERATQRGVLQGYVSIDESLKTVRGRIRMSDQVTQRPGLLFPVEVTYDEFTADVTENQILRAAVRRMLLVQRLDGGVRRRLLHLDRQLADVSLVARGNRVPIWSPNRRNAEYVPALRIAEIILQNLAAEASAGNLQVASFVVNMAKVFEDFVAAALTEELRAYPGRTREQYKTYLDEIGSDQDRRRVSMKPDVVHEVRPELILIFDAKYKAASGSGQYPNADYYQMLAYATALGQKNAWLLYAGAGEAVSRQIRNTEVVTHEFPVDLSGSPQQVLRRVAQATDLAFSLAGVDGATET